MDRMNSGHTMCYIIYEGREEQRFGDTFLEFASVCPRMYAQLHQKSKELERCSINTQIAYTNSFIYFQIYGTTICVMSMFNGLLPDWIYKHTTPGCLQVSELKLCPKFHLGARHRSYEVRRKIWTDVRGSSYSGQFHGNIVYHERLVDSDRETLGVFWTTGHPPKYSSNGLRIRPHSIQVVGRLSIERLPSGLRT